MQGNDLLAAVNSLAKREEIGPKSTPDYVGRWSHGQREPTLVHGLTDWTRTHDIKHVIWTALPPRFAGQLQTATEEQSLNYLEQLTGATKDAAEQYVRMTPHQVRTRYRKAIEDRLHWTPANKY
jgi:hypothetical protein